MSDKSRSDIKGPSSVCREGAIIRQNSANRELLARHQRGAPVLVGGHCAHRRRSGTSRSLEAANVDSLYFAAGGEEGGAPEIPQQLPGHGGMAQAIGRGSEDEEVCSETLRVKRLSPPPA